MAIEAEQVSKRYGQQWALHDVTLRVEQGQIMVLQGPSGSGKTTLLRAIAGLIPIDEGEILLGGRTVSDPYRQVPAFQRDLGFVFQTSALWPHMTVERNVTFGIDHLPKEEKRVRVRQLLQRMDIGRLGQRYPHEISGGEARRVAVARALAPQPRYLLMDEPLTNLDPELHVSLLELIREQVAATGATVLYVTHGTEEGSSIGDGQIRLDKGRIHS